MKLNTVNVIEMLDSTTLQLVAFEDTEQGNEAAEKLFTDLVREHGTWDGNSVNIEDLLDEGRFESDDYKVLLVHST